MNKHHLNDRQLQRYLNRTCSELEFVKSGKHLQVCPSCRNRLNTYLDMESVLEQMPLLAAPPGLQERIMRSVHAAQEEDLPGIREPVYGQRTVPSFVNRWRSELAHGLIAMAATFLFISSGILGKIMSINADNWGEGIQHQVLAIEAVVARISIQLLS
ncbi:hypothetical protein [Paenibacillus piri]|uniref:Zf-HC2 domain-containing protein n=1 Tax=Paenibacillus piri TaxID=2547395 RepID=A0A4R5KFT6_9BACL|nr:hypothetical protein [Paenibacillus piri]TDF94183.1 hypothetical protein E1757_25175 [Paenibacillus piri]